MHLEESNTVKYNYIQFKMQKHIILCCRYSILHIKFIYHYNYNNIPNNVKHTFFNINNYKWQISEVNDIPLLCSHKMVKYCTSAEQ